MLNYLVFKLQNDETPVVVVSIKALDKIFCHFISHGYLSENTSLKSEAEKEVQKWSLDRYCEFQDRLISFMKAQQAILQEQALVSLMHLLQKEGLNPIQKIEGKQHQFPLIFLEVILNMILLKFVDRMFIFLVFFWDIFLAETYEPHAELGQGINSCSDQVSRIY